MRYCYNMSGELIALSYNVQDVGKIMKSSKKKHQWNFTFKNKKFMLCVFESLKTGKFRIELNNKLIYEVVGGKRSISKKVQDPRLGQITIELMKITNNKYRLSVNNNTFEINNSNIHKMFNYETFEEKQKKIQNKNNSKKEEEYFGINKASEQNQTGQKKISFNNKNIFGDFKAKAKQGGIGKINLGFNKNDNKSNILKFDQGIYGKNGKFDEKNFFGNKKMKAKPKKDLFGDDFFKNSKNKKNDFEDFDMFGNQSKGKKQANIGFDEFGFGDSSNKAQSKQTGSNTNGNWDEFDIFGDNKAKPQTASNNMFEMSNPSTSSNQKKFGSHFGNNKKDDFDIFGDSSSSKNKQPKNDLFDLNIQPNTTAHNQQPITQQKKQNENFLDLDFDVTPAPPQNIPQVNIPVAPVKKDPADFLDFGNDFDLGPQPVKRQVSPIEAQQEEIPEKILTDSLSPNNQQFQDNRNQKIQNDIFDMDENQKEEFASDKMKGFINTNGAEISKIDIQQNDISQNLTNMDILDSSGIKTPAHNNQFDFEKKKPDSEDIPQNNLNEIDFDVTPEQNPGQNNVDLDFGVTPIENPEKKNDDLDFGFGNDSPVVQNQSEDVKKEGGFDDIFDQNEDIFGESERKKDDGKLDMKKNSSSDHDHEDVEEDDDDDDDDEYEAGGMMYQNAIYNNDDDDDDDDEDEEGYETYKKESTYKKNNTNEFL